MVEEGKLKRPNTGFISCESMAEFIRSERQSHGESPADYEADKARKMKADADLAELLTAKEGKKLVEIAKTERRWANALSSLRGKCMAMPARIGPMVVIAKSQADATRILDDELRQAFNDIADAGPDDDDDEPATHEQSD